MVTTLNGGSPVEAFEDGRRRRRARSGSSTPAGSPTTRTLGPSLRSDPSLSVVYYGFETRDAAVRRRPRPPGVRQGRRLAAARGARRARARRCPATGMVPAGHPGHARRATSCPPYDPAGARELLAEAGYADGAALGPVSFVANGGGYDGGIVAMLEENLGVEIDYATMDFNTYQERLATDPPQIWSTNWVADYPGPNDFLGVLLGTGLDGQPGRLVVAAVRRRHRRGDVRVQPRGRDRGLRPRDGDRPRRRPDRARSPTARRTRWSATACWAPRPTGTGILRLAGLAWAAVTRRPPAARGARPRRRVARGRRPLARRRSGPPGSRSASANRVRRTAPGSRSACRSTRTGPLARLELRLRFPDSLGPVRRDVPFDHAGGQTSATYDLDIDRRQPPRAQHDDRGDLGGLPGGRRSRRCCPRPPRSAYEDTDARLAGRSRATSSPSTGTPATRPSRSKALEIGEQGRQGHRRPARRDRRRPGRLLHLRRQGRRSGRRSARAPARTSAARRTPTSGRCSR